MSDDEDSDNPTERPASRLRWISPGAVVIWLIASAAFAFYVANFGVDPDEEPLMKPRDTTKLDA